jgi:nucleoside-diphosphate-sugar epimerase
MALRALGAVPVLADLDQPASLARLRGLASRVVHLAPPPTQGARDLRTRHLTAILPEGARVVYVSTSGVYGDCGGALVDETRTVAPKNARAARRVDAERVLRGWAGRSGGSVAILRVPGIYAQDRLPLKRLREGTPALREEDDVYTNHIQADDLARIVMLALYRGLPGRVVHASAALREVVSPMLLSFMSESRRLDNTRLRRELGVRLRYPDVHHALAQWSSTALLE